MVLDVLVLVDPKQQDPKKASGGQQQGRAVREQRQEAGTLKESSRGQQQQ